MTDPSQNSPQTLGTEGAVCFQQIKATKRTTPTASEPEPEQPVIPHVQPPLSKTEKRVLALLLKGMTERGAAAELGRSPNTVHVHVRNIYRKLGISSRKMLYQYASLNLNINTGDESINAAA